MSYKNKLLFILSLILLLPFTSPAYSKESKRYLHFPPELSPETPYDVNRKLQKKLTKQEEFVEVQRLFEILSWQNFIALNWPYSADGKPKDNIASKGVLPWETWKESYEVYKEDGSRPSPWGERDVPPNFKGENGDRILFRTNRMGIRNIANVEDEINQAFTAPIWDQNGNAVRYEVLLNEVEFDYIVKNRIYNLDGQIAFSKKHAKLNFPSATRTTPGATELKLAWRIMEPTDIIERYLTIEAFVLNEDGQGYSRALVGLVGMHVSVKTKSSPQWIWSTFEHVDNLRANQLISVNGKQLKPSFNDPDCDICPINVYPNLDGDYTNTPKNKKTGEQVMKNQIQRVIPISKETVALNHQVQNLLRKQNSVLQYYELVGTQWPTDPKSKPYDVSKHDANHPPTLPEAVTNKSGGKPTPVYLTNMIMETYFQGASLTLANQVYTAGYNQQIANAEAWHQIQGFQANGTNPNRIFGTESCMGCHYSSAIAVGEEMVDGKRTAIFGEPLSADFSWLPQLKAHFKTTKKQHVTK